MSARRTVMASSTFRTAHQCKRAMLIRKVPPRGKPRRREGSGNLSTNLKPEILFRWFSGPGLSNLKLSTFNFFRLHKSFQFHLAFDHFHDVFNVAAILLLLQLFRFLQHKFVEPGARQLASLFPGRLFGLEKRLVQLVDLFRLELRLGTSHAECLGVSRRGYGCRLFRFLLRASRFDLPGCRAEMVLDFSFFLLRHFFPEDIFVFRVGLQKIVKAESLREFQFAAAFRVALHEHIDAPRDFRGRTLPAAAEILVVFNLELADVALELAEFFFDGRHTWCNPLFSMLGAGSRTVNRMSRRRFESATAFCPRPEPDCGPTQGVMEMPAGLPGSLHCAEMFECKRGTKERFRRSKRNYCGRSRRSTNCCCNRGWRGFRNGGTAA